MERWQAIPYSAYEASTEGRIRNTKNGKVQEPSLDHNGYAIVGVRFLDQKHSKPVHLLVCLAFNGVKPIGAQCVRHLDGDKTNNRPGNLRWGTFKENAADTILHGRQVCGFDHPNVRITEPEVVEIRAAYLTHMVGRRKAKNGFIIALTEQHPHLTAKEVYKAATGRYDHMVGAR